MFSERNNSKRILHPGLNGFGDEVRPNVLGCTPFSANAEVLPQPTILIFLIDEASSSINIKNNYL